MVDFVEYVVSELKSKRLGKAGALELMRQFFGRRTSDAKLHPLLHRNVSTLTRQRYRTRLGGDEFFLRDHRVRLPGGAVAGILPGVAYLEMARAAVADAVPDLAAASMIAFENVLWLSPFIVTGERDILIDVDAAEDALEFRVFSADDAGYSTDHATGRIRFYDVVEAEPLDVGALRETLWREHWDAPAVYGRYAQIGIEYGPAHQGIVGLDSGEGQVLAEIALPDALAGEDNGAYVLHPALIDSALQAAIGLGERDARPTEPMLPFALDSLCILGDCPTRLHAFVRRADATDAEAGGLTLDLDLCDDGGNVCVQLRGLCARRFDTKGLRARTGDEEGGAASPRPADDVTEAETLVALPAWSEERPRDTVAARDYAPVHVLLCGLRDVDPSSLASLLPGGSVEAIEPVGVEPPSSRYEAFALKVFERLQDVLRRSPEAGTLLQCVVPDSAEGRLLTGLDGLLRTAGQENPSLSTQLVIVAVDADARRVAADLAYAAAHAHVSPLRLSAEGWRKLEWTFLPQESEAEGAQPYKEDGVFVITGGLGGLGSLVAHDILSLARHAQVVLTGRAPLDAHIRARLEASEFAPRLHYRRLDLESPDDCRQAIAAIGSDFGPIRGVFHCAGTHADNVILKKTVPEAAAVLAPKVRGTWHLDEATRDLDLDFFALFSSGVSVFGNVGQADYSAANGFLDVFAAQREALVALGQRRGRSVSINWPLWEAGGMQLDAEGQQWLRARTGLTPMRSESGVAVLRRALAGHGAQWLALFGDGRRLRRLFDPAPPPAPVRQAAAPAREAPAPPAPAATGGDLLAQCRDFLRREFAPVLKIAAAQIDIEEALESYGINSILAMNLTAQLEQHFGPLPKTLFFEYQTLAALSEHLVQAHEAELRALLSAAAPVAVPPEARRPAKPAQQRQETKAPARGKATASAALMRRTQPGLPARYEPIAVVGLSGRYPDAWDLDEYWRNLRDGKDCIVEVPPERWRWQDYYTSDRDTRGHYSKWGGFIRGADEFDPQFFNISPREAAYIDPQERLFLQHAWMAIEDAGYSRKSLRVPRAHGLAGQVGVYAGVMYGEYNRSGSLASIANRVSYVLDLHGPSLTLDTMCSSSLTAMHLACQDLRSGRTDMALAGGVNLSLHPGKYSMLSAGQFISTAGHCQSFGEGGDGYIPGEGVGVVVLKRLSDAERDGDAIHALIRGSALNHGGKTNGYTVPNPQAQAAVIAEALHAAGVDARQVSFVEAHGTGTKLGDPIEIAAISKAFREHTQDVGFCLIGSAKSNIGHCESAAGVAGLTKVILQMRHRQIVPSLHSERLNPNIDFEATPFVVNQQLRAWDAPVVDGRPVPRIAGLSSFGAGGSNAHFIIEEYAAPAPDASASAGVPAIVPLSARTPEQVTRRARDLLDFLQAESLAGRPVDHVALAATLQVGRDAMEERLAFVVESTARLQDALRAFLDGDVSSGYRGQVKAHKALVGLFFGDLDYDEVLDKWVAQRKLTKLAELWTKGLDLDWSKFHGPRRPRRMHLPTYPFAHEKYWIDPIEGLFPTDVGPRASTDPRGAPSAMSAAGSTPADRMTRAALHPLLHENTSDLDQLRFSSLFRAGEFAAEGEALPPAILQEMARVAAARAAGAAHEPSSVELHDLRFGAPFVADGRTALHVALSRSSDGALDFDIYSGDGDGEVHAQGAAVIAPGRAHTEVSSARLGDASPRAVTAVRLADVAPVAMQEPVVAALDAAPILSKPNAIALVAPASAPLVVAGTLPKPREARLATLAGPVAGPLPPASAVDPPGPIDVPIHTAPERRGEAPVLAASGAPAALAAPAPDRREDVRAFLTRTLAQALYLDEASIDDDRSFVDLGLDSIVGVEWVKSINKGLGLDIAATRVYDYANIAALAVYVASQLPAPADGPAATVEVVSRRPAPATPVDAPALAPAPAVRAATPVSYPASGAPASLPGVEALLPDLRRSLARALYLDEDALDDERSFVDLGLDSIVGVEWVKAINKTYGLEISATRVYDYANLRALAGFLRDELAQVAPERLPSATPVPIAQPVDAPVVPVLPRPPAPADVTSVLRRRSHAGRSSADAGRAAEARHTDEKVAIVGMSGRYPDAKDLGEFWRNLVEGRNSIKEVPRERWNVDDYYDPTPGKPGRIYCKWLGALDEIECFDPMFFQISPSEAEIMDPQHRLFMQEAYRAFQDASYSSAALSNRKCGVYLGIMSSEYPFLLAKGNPLNVETTGNSFAIGAARIAYHLNLKGPAIPIDTACSSSLVAIHLACQALVNHEIDMGLAGGVGLYLIPESYLGMCRAGMLSRDGQCKTFDNGADGFVPGEGVGTVVLKRLSDAERDGDSIYGVIIGSGINQDGKTNGITAPSVNSQIDLLRDVYRRYDIDASTINYVETHGTGTKLGDPIELEALSTVFREHGDRQGFCALGAVKTNVGHTSGAAGVAGVHKVLLSLRNRTIAPNVNLRHENALFDFAASPFYISKAAHDWTPVPGHRRRAAVSAFGFSGTNAHVVIEEYAPPERPRVEVQQPYVIPLSARSADQLHVMARELLAFLDATGHELALRDLAWTLQVGRDPMRERCAWVVDSMAELQARLRVFVSAPAGDAQGCQRGTVGRARDTQAPTEQAAALRQRDGARQTAALATLWVQGAELDWPSFHAGATPRRVPGLPGYPFAKERCWPQPAAHEASAAQVGTGSAAQLRSPSVAAAGFANSGLSTGGRPEARQSTCYVPEWREAPLPERRIPFGPDDTLLVLDTDDRLFDAIKARLQATSPLAAIVLVRLGESARQDAPDRFSVEATQPRHFEALLETLRAQGRVPTHVIHHAGAARLPTHGGDDAAVERALRAGVDGLFGLCKALVAGGARQSPCTFVSFHHATDADDAAACQALAAFYRSLALENNRYNGRVLTLEHEGLDASASLAATLACLVDELQSPPQRETEVRCRPGAAASTRRFVRVLARRDLDPTSTADAPLKHGGVYLLTGGLGGLGYVFARHLAEHYRARLVLSGRSALDPRAEDKLERLRALGADVIYQQADVADAVQARALIEQAKARFGALNGVLHSAGVNDDALLIRKSRESFRQVLAPKVLGTWHLDRLTAAEPLDLFVLFSSGAGTFGNAGQTDYAYANAFMDAFAEQRERWRARHERCGRTLSIGWPYWQEGGMQLPAAELRRTEERTGLCALPTDIGLAYWEKLVRSELPRALALYGHPAKIAAHCGPSSAPSQAATSRQEEEPRVDRVTLLALTQRYLCELVQAETKIPLERIDVEERFEAFGFDSIMISRFNGALERDLGELPKTLLYEFETVAELAAYLCDTSGPALTRVLAGESPTSATPAPGAPEPTALSTVAAGATVPASASAALPVSEGTPAHAEPIAIIGVHAEFPQAAGLDALWRHLQSGRDLVQVVPESRWNQAEFFDPDPEQAEHGKIYCKWGAFIEDFDKFDAPFFNIPAHEADILDPQERRFLQSAWAALEDAGYTRERLKQRYPKGKSADVGVFVGVTTNSYHLLAPEAWQRGQMVTPSAMPWSIANRVSYALDLQGPSLPIDTACSSSLVATHLACESLRRRECQLALAGGVNLYLHPAKYQSFCQRRMLALGDQCRSYGDGDDGFIPGEGVGTLVLKPLHLAERDGDPIYGVIRGSAYDHSGRSNGYATPNPNAQAHVIAQALAQGGVPARSIGFIEGHGTGTRMGDSLEIAAITQAFSQHTTDRQFCAIASLKANLGHAESATSIAGIAKILMQFKHRQIAPSIHADVVNPDIDFARSPCFLQTRLGAWEAPEGQPRRALINAFGAGGVNACAVLEEYSPQPAASPAPGGRCLFVVSAMNAERLREYVERHVEHLERDADGDFAARCRAVQVGREAMPERLALLVDDAAQLREALTRWLDAGPQAVSGPVQLWQGRVDPSSGTGPTTREQREQMQALCEARDLAGLARFWTQGGKVEWQRLHVGAPAIAGGVPGYPFARERHWAVDPEQAERGPAAPTARLHPLISHNASTLEQVCFDALLDLDQYYARDHRIQGRCVFPGSGFIEMACVAATLAGQRRVLRLKDVFWVQPLALTEPSRNPRIRLSNAGKDGTGFVVTTLDDEQEEVVHCEGRAIFQAGPASGHAPPPSLQAWRQRCGAPRAGAEYYELFRRMGFDYGPSFRVIDAVATGDGCAMARLELQAGQAGEFEQYVLHPCLIDGALQTVVALLASGEGGVPHLPFAIDEIEILGPLAQRCHVLAERAGGAGDPHAGVLQFDIRIVSDGGEPLVKITNFYVRALVAPDAVVSHGQDESTRLSLAVTP